MTRSPRDTVTADAPTPLRRRAARPRGGRGRPSGRPRVRRPAYDAPGRTLADAAPAVKVAIAADIDSFNPFMAILASSTGILRFQYQNLCLRPKTTRTCRAGRQVGDLHRRQDLDLPHAQGPQVVGRPAASPPRTWPGPSRPSRPTTGLKQANGGLLSRTSQSVAAKDDETLVLTLKAPQAPNPGTQLPIMPEHVWSKVADPATFANDKDSVGLRPVHRHQLRQGLPASSSSREPQLLAGQGQGRRHHLRAVQEHRCRGPGPENRRNRHRQRPDPGPVQGPAERSRDHHQRRYGPPLPGHGHQPGRQDRARHAASGDGNPALQDPKVRQAIVMAIDNKTLLDKVLQGLGQPATGEIPGAYPLYNWNATDRAEATTSPAANKLLDEAGYAKGADGIRVDKDGKPLKLRLMGRNTDPTHQQMADYVKPWLKEIGIDVTVVHEVPRTGQRRLDAWATTTCTSPAGAWARTRTSSSPSTSAPRAPTPTAPAPRAKQLLRPGVRRPLQGAARGTRPGQAQRTWSSRHRK